MALQHLILCLTRRVVFVYVVTLLKSFSGSTNSFDHVEIRRDCLIFKNVIIFPFSQQFRWYFLKGSF